MVRQAAGGEREALVVLRGVGRAFATPAGTVWALRDVDLRIAAGEFVAVVGRSGSGKSTLLHLLAGVDRPSAGEVWVAGTPVHALPEARLARWRGRTVGIVFQFFQLMPTLTALENVLLAMDFVGVVPPAERLPRARRLLAEVGLAAEEHRLPAALSGGQQQRVAIARALANDPPLLLADEPTGNLDSQGARAVLELFERLVAQGKTLVMVTHDPELAQRAQRRVTLADGRVVDDRRLH